MTDTRRLIEQVGEQAPFPNDAFERMLRRRDRKQRNQRIAAAGVGIAVFAAAIAFALGGSPWSTVDTSVPGDTPTPSGEVTFWFDFDGISPFHNLVTVNGVPIEGTMTNGPQHVYRYRWDPVVAVPAGASIVVEEAGVTGEITGWINADGPPGSPHLYELDLAAGTASMPTEPGNYIVEIHVPDPPGGAYFTDLVPIRVVAPEEMGLAFSFEPYDVNHMVYVNGVPLPGEMDGGETTDGSGPHPFYIFAPDRRIDVPTGARIQVEGANVLDDFADEPHAWIDACCDTSTPPSRLYALELGGSASMPAEPGRYFLEIRWTCQTCEPDAGVMFLFPVRVAAP